MQTDIQQYGVLETCGLKFGIPISDFFSEEALQIEMPSSLFPLCNLLVPPSLNRFLKLISVIYSCFISELFSRKEKNPVDFNLSSRNSKCLNFTVNYFNPISHRPFPKAVQIHLQNFYIVFIFNFPINYAPVSE